VVLDQRGIRSGWSRDGVRAGDGPFEIEMSALARFVGRFEPVPDRVLLHTRYRHHIWKKEYEVSVRPLACDPTIIYALKREDKYKGKLGWAELKFDSPYNTRLYKDLPPGPICNPGYDSIEAALYPASSKYLYFVAKDQKLHHFSKTLKEHNWAVRKYIINKKKN
jgi:hypothetical protein